MDNDENKANQRALIHDYCIEHNLDIILFKKII